MASQKQTEESSSVRERLVNTTLSLIDRQGYCATGLNQILAESDTPKGSLYYYFPRGKEQLVTAALRATKEASAQWLDKVLADVDAVPEAFGRMIRLLADHVAEMGCCGGGPVAAVTLEVAANSEILRNVCAETYGAWRDSFVRKLTTAGMKTQHAESVALFLQSAIEGAVILSRSEKSTEPLQAVATQVEQFLAYQIANLVSAPMETPIMKGKI